MNIIKKLRSKPNMVIIAGLLLFGLTLIPAASFAGNDHHQGRRNGESHQVNNQQRNYHVENNRHRHNRARHPMKHKYSHYRKHKGSDHGKHRNRHHNQPHYVVINKDHYRSPRLGIQIGVGSGKFDIVFRD
jgi:hypothetical protein